MAQKQEYIYRYPRPMLTCDAAVFSVSGGALSVLLIRRKHSPFEGYWALPGGFVEMDEPLDTCAARELYEETGVKGMRLAQLHTFGEPNRDPRGRSVSVAYLALVRADGLALKAATDATEAGWHSINLLPELAFDHADILSTALEWFRTRLDYRGLGAQVLPDAFTLAELRALHEAIRGAPIDQRAFEHKMREAPFLMPACESTGETPTHYRFVAELTEPC